MKEEYGKNQRVEKNDGRVKKILLSENLTKKESNSLQFIKSRINPGQNLSRVNRTSFTGVLLLAWPIIYQPVVVLCKVFTMFYCFELYSLQYNAVKPTEVVSFKILIHINGS